MLQKSLYDRSCGLLTYRAAYAKVANPCVCQILVNRDLEADHQESFVSP